MVQKWNIYSTEKQMQPELQIKNELQKLKGFLLHAWPFLRWLEKRKLHLYSATLRSISVILCLWIVSTISSLAAKFHVSMPYSFPAEILLAEKKNNQNSTNRVSAALLLRPPMNAYRSIHKCILSKQLLTLKSFSMHTKNVRPIVYCKMKRKKTWEKEGSRVISVLRYKFLVFTIYLQVVPETYLDDVTFINWTRLLNLC